MNFALTEDQAMIREAAQSFLADASGSAAVRSAMATESGYDPALWEQIGSELGWCGTAIPEEYGGLGLGPVELALIFEQAGRRLLCAPYFSTVGLAANVLLNLCGEAARKRFLPDIAAGKLKLSVPLAGEDWAATALRVRADGKGWILDGQCPRVPDGASADWLLVFAKVQEQLGVFAVERAAPGVKLQSLPTWDQTRRFAAVEFGGSVAERLDESGCSAEALLCSAALARLAIAAEQLGGAQQCLDLTVEYVAQRQQFGRAIASFQAVKHRCAEMMVRVEALRSAVYGAAACAAGTPPVSVLDPECAMARALAADTYFFCAQEAIQLHGGVGFTWEYDPQLHFKRAQAGSHWLGGAEAMRERIARAVLN
jgi:alkylation response protein AidB-like acyl-CoA dehydrogenase